MTTLPDNKKIHKYTNLEWVIGKCGFTSQQFETCLTSKLLVIQNQQDQNQDRNDKQRMKKAIAEVTRAVLPIYTKSGKPDKRRSHPDTLQETNIIPTRIKDKAPKEAETEFSQDELRANQKTFGKAFKKEDEKGGQAQSSVGGHEQTSDGGQEQTSLGAVGGQEQTSEGGQEQTSLGAVGGQEQTSEGGRAKTSGSQAQTSGGQQQTSEGGQEQTSGGEQAQTSSTEEEITLSEILHDEYKEDTIAMYEQLLQNYFMTNEEFEIIKDEKNTKMTGCCNIIDEITLRILQDQSDALNSSITDAQREAKPIKILMESCHAVVSRRLYVDGFYKLPDTPKESTFRAWKSHFWLCVSLACLLVALEVLYQSQVRSSGLNIAVKERKKQGHSPKKCANM